jgi:phosphoribosylformimino-5-aminoimidazole carboxamide ribotide isomerase
VLILPAIDLLGGKCVRLTHGLYDQVKTYDQDPLAVGHGFIEAGAEWIHIVDLDAARSGDPANLSIIRDLARVLGAKLEVGGGVRSLERARALLDAGVARVVVGSKLVEDRDLAARMFDDLGEEVVAGIDSKDGKVAIHGWTAQTDWDTVSFCKELESAGARRVIVTDIARDGALQGANVEFMKAHVEALRIPVIASGGVTNLEDIRALTASGVEGAIVGKAIYEGRIDLSEAIRVGRPVA